MDIIINVADLQLFALISGSFKPAALSADQIFY